MTLTMTMTLTLTVAMAMTLTMTPARVPVRDSPSSVGPLANGRCIVLPGSETC